MAQKTQIEAQKDPGGDAEERGNSHFLRSRRPVKQHVGKRAQHRKGQGRGTERPGSEAPGKARNGGNGGKSPEARPVAGQARRKEFSDGASIGNRE